MAIFFFKLWTLNTDRRYLTNACNRALNLLKTGTIISLQAVPGINRKAYEDDSLLECDGVLSVGNSRNIKRKVMDGFQEYLKVSQKGRLIFTRLHCFTSSKIIILADVASRM